MTPVRIQRSRAKGWRMPPGAIYVGRPTRWGNPFDWRDPLIGHLTRRAGYPGLELWQRAVAVGLFNWWMGGAPLLTSHFEGAYEALGVQLTEGSIGGSLWMPTNGFIDIPLRPDISPLRGHDLACWCLVVQPGLSVACHADVLLELANR